MVLFQCLGKVLSYGIAVLEESSFGIAVAVLIKEKQCYTFLVVLS